MAAPTLASPLPPASAELAAAPPQLRPLGLGQLLDRAIRLYRRNFFTFIGILAVALVPSVLLQLAGSVLLLRGMSGLANADPNSTSFGEMFGPAYWGGMGLTLFSLLVYLILIYIASGALTRAVSDAYLGQRVSLLGSYRRLGWSWLKLLITLVLSLIITLVISVWWLVPIVGWLTGLGMLTFFGAVVVPVAIPVVVLEKAWHFDGLVRAWHLARQRFWWTFGFAMLLGLFSLLLVAGPSAIVNFVLGAAMPGDVNDPFGNAAALRTVGESLAQLVFSLLYLPLHLAGMTVLYFDLRVRTEGFDLAVQAQGTDATAVAVADLPAQAPAPQYTGLVNRFEMLSFTGLSVIFGVIYAVIFGAFFGLILFIFSQFGRNGAF